MTNFDRSFDSKSGSEGALVTINGNQQISMQLLQDVYKELTGKTESLNRRYDKSFQIHIEDIDQLNSKIHQACEQYNIQAQNCAIKVVYLNGVADTFSSYDRFKLQCASGSSAVESISLVYNFLIILPKLESPQPYEVTIRLASRAAIVTKLNKDEHYYPHGFARYMGAQTALLSIKYVDYTVARSLLGTIDEWFDSIAVAKSFKYAKFVKRFVWYIDDVFAFLFLFIVAYLGYSKVDNYMSVDLALDVFAKFSLILGLGLFVAYRMGYFLGGAIRTSILDVVQMSYINMNVGDKKMIASLNKSNRKQVIKTAASILIAIAVNVIATIIVMKVL